MGKMVKITTTYICDFCGQVVDAPCHEMDIPMRLGMDARKYLTVRVEPHMDHHPDEESLVVCRDCVREALAREFGLEVK